MRNRRIIAAALTLLLAACAANTARDGPTAMQAPRSWPTARPASPDALPEILAVNFSSDTVSTGDWWAGQIATASNVASIEVRSPSFSISVPRVSVGQFAFRLHVIDLPTLYRRPYDVAVIARNTAGIATARHYRINFR